MVYNGEYMRMSTEYQVAITIRLHDECSSIDRILNFARRLLIQSSVMLENNGGV